MENKKYELALGTERTVHGTRILRRVRALRDFGDVKKGELGGYIQSEENLSHDGDCWVYQDAEVLDNARVSDNARVQGKAKVYNDAIVCEDAAVGYYTKVKGNAKVGGSAMVVDSGCIMGTAEIGGDAVISGRVYIDGDAKVYKTEDYITFKKWWSEHKYDLHITWTRSNNMWSSFEHLETSEELIKRGYSESERSGSEYERIVKYVEEILRDGREE